MSTVLTVDADLPLAFNKMGAAVVDTISNTLIGATITQLRNLSVLFGGRVAGAAEFAAIKTQGFMATPSCYVVPLGSTATINESQSDLKQVMSSRIGVIVMFSNVANVLAGDRRGQTVTELYSVVKFGIFHALLNWNPMSVPENPQLAGSIDPILGHGIRGYYFVGEKLLDYDPARLWITFDFALDIQITGVGDGWRATGVPLNTIGLNIVNPASPDPGDIPSEVLVSQIITLEDDDAITRAGCVVRRQCRQPFNCRGALNTSMKTIRVKPSPNMVIFDPERKDRIESWGRLVPLNTYWIRRIQQRDCVVVEDEPEKKPEKKVEPPKAPDPAKGDDK